ncbi:MAG: class II SORL domain-containing protein [Thermoleophilia bacterium]|nr:class II SORL domain-containing protein [Thermoleophilia bacterium]
MESVSTINTAKDIANMNELEKKHVPMIHIGGTPEQGKYFEVTVWLGEDMPHPMEMEHHIEFIDLYLDDMFITRCDLAWQNSYPKCSFNIKLDRPGNLRAFERCNVHGDWTYSTEIRF